MSQLAQRLFMASGGKKDSTYVDDVFSTYLYKGNGTLQTVINGIKLSNNNQGSSIWMRDDGTASTYIPATEDFKFGTGAFTIEFFIYFVHSTDYIAVFDGRTNNSNNNNDRTVTGLLANGQFNWWNLAASAVIPNSAATQVPVHQWSHVAYVREGTGTNEAKMYINGSLVGTGTDPQDYNVNQPCRIGGHAWAPGVLYGSFSNYRVVKGTAVYTSNFTVPTEPLTAISGTVLLCFQSSTDPFAATVDPGGTWTSGTGSTPIAQSFGPFTANDGEGGMTWIKGRTGGGYGHRLVDTVRGATKAIESYDTTVEATESNGLAAFNNNGFTLGSQGHYNGSGMNMSSWTWRKQKGFFDVVTWTGNNTAGRQIPHNLGSRPGMVAIKCTSHTHNWTVWHRNLSSNAKGLILNDTSAEYTTDDFNGAAPTSEVIYLSATNNSNGAGKTYVAYLWAGGESTAATARSVAFSSTGANDGAKSLTVASSSDTDFGSGDFTMECWFKDTRTNEFTGLDVIFSMSGYNSGYSGNSFTIYTYGGGFRFFDRTGGSYTSLLGTQGTNSFGQIGQWHHFAWTRSGSGSNNNTVWVDGNVHATFTNTRNYTDGQNFYIGANDYNNTGTPDEFGFNGKISNVRITKGQAIYTSAFKPSTEPLTTTTAGANPSNVKIICCNNSSITGSTLTSGTISSTNTPTASTESPFDDPAGFTFGEGGDQNIIKCGSYGGNGNNDGPEVYLGWEPQYILFKNATSAERWAVFDTMRGITSGGRIDKELSPSRPNDEVTQQVLDVTPTGFRCTYGNDLINSDGGTITYMAIRRPDGLVGKPATVGSDVFAQAYGVNSGDFRFTSNFPVDFAWAKLYAGTGNWWTSARLIQGREIKTNNTDSGSAGTNKYFDSNVSWHLPNADNTYISHMWKRHAGFDVVTDIGNGEPTGKQIAHGLGVVPEMIWRKNTDGSSDDWQVYHIGFNGGTNPHLYRMYLNTNNGENPDQWTWDSPPTATHFSVGSNGAVNRNTEDFITMLFASVDGISKVGYYIGDGTNNRQITTGFQPRFITITLANQGGGYGWQTMDSVRGFIGTGGSGNEVLRLDNTNAQSSQNTYFTPTATGFTITESAFNGSSQNWIYYAHA